MKEPNIYNKVQQKLAEYDSIDLIHPSDRWYKLLSAKVENNRRTKPGTVASGIYIALIFLVIFNLGIILNSIMNSSESRGYANTDLQVISSQLLIGSTSVNN
jgi:hypothetical protein